MVIVTA